MFQNPLALWGLLALAVPVLVHFFNFRRPRRLLFSQTAFLQSISQTTESRNKLKRLLLLAARLLAVACVVLVFAEPFIPATDGTTAQTGAPDYVILVDDSPSMALADERGTYLQQAKDIGAALIKQAGAGTQARFWVQPMGKLPANAPFVRADAAAKQLQALQTGFNSISLEQALTRLAKLVRAQPGPKVIYVLSDFQRATVLADTLQQINLGDARIVCLPVGSQGNGNTYIQSVQPFMQVAAADAPHALRVLIKTDKAEAQNDIGLRLLLQGKEVSMASVKLPKNGEAVAQLLIPPQYTGWLSGEVRMEDDGTRFDKRRYFALYIPASRNLAVVEGAERSANLQLLLGQLLKGFKVTFVPERDFGQLKPEQYDGIVLAGVRQLSSGVQDRLARWVLEGGGLWVLPADDMQSESMNSLLRQLNAATFGAFKRWEGGVMVNKPETGSALFAGLFASGNTSKSVFDGFDVRKQYALQLPAGTAADVPLRTDNDQPFMAFSRAGKGAVVVSATHLTALWGNFALHHSFAPVTYRILTSLTQPPETPLYYDLGNEQLLKYNTPLKDLVTLTSADNESLVPEQYAAGGTVRLQLREMELRAGNYNVVQRDTLLAKTAFNIRVAESDLTLAADAAVTAYFADAGWKNVTLLRGTPQLVAERAAQALKGVALWKYFLIFALLFLAAEVLILWLLPDAQVPEKQKLTATIFK
jgi:hypothetical protein